MGIPALPPGIPPPQFPGFPPPVPPGTPMIPVPMSIMAPAPTVLVPTVSMVGKHLGARKDHPGLKAKENDENCGPTTTVFVGNISEKASDMLIRQLLAKCGLVLSWKRVQGASGKLQAFGFCEYKEPESTLRALRLLHDLQIGEKKLLVKVDAKTKAQLDEWKAKKKASNGNARPETVTNDDEEALDEEEEEKQEKEKERENGNEKENESERESEKGNGNERERKTRSVTEKKMKKMLTNEGNLKENSEKKKLLTKSALRIGKSENGRKPGSMRKRPKEKKKEEEKWQKKLKD